MAINFPNSPSNGATHTVGNITYVYDSAKGVWKDSPAGLTQSIDALTDVDISTSAPTNGQILEYNSSSGKFVPADSSAGVTVYATINDLPLTGVTEGSMALVDSTDKLYIFSDTGWYSIALVNTSPSISGVNPAYTLAMDGTALTISVTASDPEGIPITYSIVSDTSGNIATVAQGTGSNTNQWTITPSTNTAHAGNFTLVFRASDGTNVASASSTFTLAFAHIDSKYTSMLLTSVGANNGVNNSYTDSSASAHTITRNGDTNQVTFSPYRHGGYSTYLDGNGDHLIMPNDSSFNLNGEFCIEFWVYLQGSGYSATVQRVIAPNSSAYNTAPYISIGNDTGITGGPAVAGVLCATRAVNAGNPQMHANTTGTTATGTYKQIPLNKWTHCALTRDSSNVVRMWQDGVLVATNTDSTAFDFTYGSTVGPKIGQSGWAPSSTAESLTGFLSDFRIVKGSAVYTSAFTPPDERLTAITNTSLLTCHLPYIKDGSTNGHSITVNGNTTTEPWAPYDNAGYVASNHGGSAYFDGNGDYFDAASTTAFDFGTGDFTVEFWIYLDNISGEKIFFETRAGHTDAGLLIMLNSGVIKTLTSGAVRTTGGTSIRLFEWFHVAVVRDSTSLRTYLNGTLESGSTSYSSAINSPFNKARIAARFDGANIPSGNVSDIRVVKGTAVYTGNFTPPTAPLTQTGGTYPSTTNVNTSITSGHTKLLLPCDDASIIDKSQSIRDIRVLGAFASSSTQTKFGTTSIKYNGSDARAFLRSGNLFNLGTGEFTVECWLYKDATGTAIILDARPSNSGAPWYLGVDYQEKPFFYDGSSYTSTTALSTNTWAHIAVTRDSSNVLRVFLNGTVEHTTNSYTTNLTATDQTVTGVRAGFPGDYFSGYIEDLRVTKGKARYTANFTAPTAALDA
ncbi:MAG: putative concanavalin A-like lectin/glucanases superfamily protein [Prokaryotic dsDNA virus sp.]|nr:MAG: putative concanavalin A-like lectin/glucanases superfamily protein [Prokaryotic dsDNA virus sp.]